MKHNIREAIAHIFYRMKEEGVIDQTTLAKRLGKSDGAISDYLGGRRRMHEDTILAMCRALGVEWHKLGVDLDLPEPTPRQVRIKRIAARLEQTEGDELLDDVEAMLDLMLRNVERNKRWKK